MKKAARMGGQTAAPGQLAAIALLALTAACSNEIRSVPPRLASSSALPPLAVDPALIDPQPAAQPMPSSTITGDGASIRAHGTAPAGGTELGVSTSAMAAPSPPEAREERPARSEPPSAAATAAAERSAAAAPRAARPAKPPAAMVAERPAERQAAPPPKSPTLNVEELKTRLRDTTAIGVFTKLALKNQLDELLKQFEAHHREGRKGLTALRQPYDMLVLKVLAVLQDGDPDLARAISSSREAIWKLLADPVKFNALT